MTLPTYLLHLLTGLAIGTGIFLTDLWLRKRLINRAAARILADQARGRAALAAIGIPTDLWQCAALFRYPDGSMRHIMGSLRSNRDEIGVSLGFLAECINATPALKTAVLLSNSALHLASCARKAQNLRLGSPQ